MEIRSVHQHNKESLVELLKMYLNIHATACYSITNFNKKILKLEPFFMDILNENLHTLHTLVYGCQFQWIKNTVMH